MESRFILVKRSCHFCNDALKAINKINLRLPIDKKIKIVECMDWEEFGLQNIPLLEEFEKMGFMRGYPTLYIEGSIIDPSPTPEQLFVLLKEFLKDDLLF